MVIHTGERYHAQCRAGTRRVTASHRLEAKMTKGSDVVSSEPLAVFR